MKKIRLTEKDLHNIVSNTVKRIITEIGDTPRGQYMLGRLSAAYDEPELYLDDYDEVPEVADYASKNWQGNIGGKHHYAFNLGKGDEQGLNWIHNGSQEHFRAKHGLPQMQEGKKTKIYRMTESDLHGIISKAVKKYLKEDVGMASDSWYNEEDYEGKVGQVGMIRSYDIGYITTEQMEQMAQEEGFSDMTQAITYWWNEVSSECPWSWTPQGHGYGYNGTTIAKIGNVVIKDIYGQIMIDEYPPIG